MKPGGRYQVKVTDIKVAVKKFNKVNIGDVVRHDIHIEDRAGNTAVCEFISKSEIVTEFAQGVFQWIKCIYPDGDGGTIEPCEPPDENTRHEPVSPPSSPLPQTYVDTPNVDCSAKNVSGSTLAFSVAYAKDIKVAEIGNRPPSSKATTDDIEDVLKWAKMINKSLCNNLI